MEVPPKKQESPPFVSAEAGEVLRQTGLTILLDGDPSTELWRRSIDQFLGDLSDQKVPLRIYPVEADNHAEEPYLGLGEFSGADAPGTIMMVSTCTSPAWHNGTMPKALQLLAEQKNVSIVSLFPPTSTYRSRTALAAGVVREAYVVPDTPSGLLTANTQLTYQKRKEWFTDEEDSFTSVVPLIELKADVLTHYAGIIAGDTELTVRAVHFEPEEMAQEYEYAQQENEVQPQIDPQRRVMLFMTATNTHVKKLVGMLAATPLDSAVADRVRQEMFPEATDLHFAEVILSGLLEQIGKRDGIVLYDFLPGVREQLLNAVPLPVSHQALNVAASVLGERYPIEKVALARLAEGSLQEDAATMPINEHTIEFIKVCASVWARRGVHSTHLQERIATYEAQQQSAVTVASDTIEHIDTSERGAEAVLRLIAASNSRDFQTYHDLKNHEGFQAFPTALKAMALFLAEYPHADVLVQEEITRTFGAPLQIVEYPVKDVYWRDGGALYKVRMQYLDDAERARGINPTTIDVDFFELSPGEQQGITLDQIKAQQVLNYEFSYRQLPGETKEAGSFSGHLYPTDEMFYVTTHWGRTSITSAKDGEGTINPQITTPLIARMTKAVASALVDQYDKITKQLL